MTFRSIASFSAVRGAFARAAGRAAALAGAAALAALLLAPGAVRAKPAQSGPNPVASAVRVGGNQHDTRFVLDLTHKVDIAVFSLADPYRVVIDLPQVTFKLPRHAGEHGRGLVTAYRYGLVMRGGSRIVLDTAKPVRVKKAFVLPPASGQPARLVVDLSATDRASFLHTVALQNRDERAKRPRRIAVAPKEDKDPRPLIVLDPGHGGIDNGTHWKNIDEKDIVLAFARVLREKLNRIGKYQVLMTRTDDTYIPLNDRVRFARRHHASLFISLHADSLPAREGHAQGATVYTLSEKASDAQAAELANSENSSDVLAGVDLSNEPSDVASILFDLAQRETKTFSVRFAHHVVGQLRDTARLYKHPIKSAGFVVLKDPDVPSVLIELGYLSSAADRKNLISAAWRSKTAGALAEAVNAFFAARLANSRNAR
ncbi:MAG: N-acetylmuramoyl-L-alanine amidase [Pseudolabrys sp.]